MPPALAVEREYNFSKRAKPSPDGFPARLIRGISGHVAPAKITFEMCVRSDSTSKAKG
jgi:hypothetical protein